MLGAYVVDIVMSVKQIKLKKRDDYGQEDGEKSIQKKPDKYGNRKEPNIDNSIWFFKENITMKNKKIVQNTSRKLKKGLWSITIEIKKKSSQEERLLEQPKEELFLKSLVGIVEILNQKAIIMLDIPVRMFLGLSGCANYTTKRSIIDYGK